MRVLVLGAGGIGGYFGGRLAEAGVDTTFLVRPARANQLAGGLRIIGPSDDTTVNVETVTEAAAPFDLVVLSCKAYDLDGAIAAIRPAVDADTTILPLLNGIGHLERLDAAFDAGQTIGGSAQISVAQTPEGAIRRMNRLHTLTFGARDAAQDSRCDGVGALLEKAPFDVRRSEKILQAMWDKFAFITAAGAIACLTRASVAATMATDDGERLTVQMLEECRCVAAAEGFPIGDKALGWMKPFLTDRTSDFKPSMLHDIENGGRIEADHLQGDMIRRGAAHGIATDLLKIAFCQQQAYQHARDAA